nr:MAG TPA: G protein-regulated inducer of neurite outgrowth C-terminus [Caudoviricetes sp.]
MSCMVCPAVCDVQPVRVRWVWQGMTWGVYRQRQGRGG